MVLAIMGVVCGCALRCPNVYDDQASRNTLDTHLGALVSSHSVSLSPSLFTSLI